VILADRIVPAAATGRLPLAWSVALTVGCGATYGAALGAWTSPRLAFYAAIKVPLLMLITAAITTLLNWVIASLSGLPLRLRETVILSLMPLAIASLILAACAPVALFFSRSIPAPGTSQRTLHNVLYLTHVLLVAAAGITGTTFLQTALTGYCGGDGARAARIRRLWIAAYAVVGGEVAWALRPFVGSVYLDVAFLRPDALHGNVYEFLFTDVIPHLLRSL
jgi:hypothetical protein